MDGSFQLAVIFQGIAARASKGQNSNPMAEIIGQLAEPVAERAYDLLPAADKARL